jgi:hypothetical protein
MVARDSIIPVLALSFVLASACSSSSEPAKPKKGTKGLSAAALAELRTPDAWVPTPFLDGVLTVSLPPMLRKRPAPQVAGAQYDANAVVSMSNEDDTFGFVLNRGEYLREADVGTLCADLSTADLAATGGRVVAREVLTTHATPICKLHSVTGGYLTMQRLVSIEGHGTHIAVTLADGHDEATKLAAERILGTIQLKLTAEGSACPAEAAAKCVDDRRLMSCKDGRWSSTYCNVACEGHGGPGDGCSWDDQRNEPVCACGKP